jgi:hypothetical protein
MENSIRIFFSSTTAVWFAKNASYKPYSRLNNHHQNHKGLTTWYCRRHIKQLDLEHVLGLGGEIARDLHKGLYLIGGIRG